MRRAGTRCEGYRVRPVPRPRPSMDVDAVIVAVLLAAAECGIRGVHVEDRDGAYHAVAQLLDALGMDVEVGP